MLSRLFSPRPSRRDASSLRRRRRAVPTAEALEGRQVLSTFTVTSTLDDGSSGTLRWAISQVDGSRSPSNTINFKIRGSGAETITLQSALPAITRPVTIDGTSQPGYHGTPVVYLNGSTCSFDGFDVECPHVTIEGFAIGCFDTGVYINSSYDVVEDCYIGTDWTGRHAAPNNNGVVVAPGSSYNTVGGPYAWEGNVISANHYSGVVIDGQGASHNVVENDYIGTDYTGRYPLGNTTGVSIYGGASYNTVEYDVISANTVGVEVSGNPSFGLNTTGNVVAFNVIGSDPYRRYNLGNSEGVHLYNVVGNTVYGNYIAYSSNGGVVETDYYHPRNTVLGNTFYHNPGGNIVLDRSYVPG